MTDVLRALIVVQILMGGFDTLYHHELTERLAWRPSQAGELRLHGARNLAYGVIFAALGWCEPHGAAAVALMVLLLIEVGLTLWDFVEEDRTRRLPASERVLHALLTLNYGVVLAVLAPLLAHWSSEPTAVVMAGRGPWSWLLAGAAIGVVLSGARDLAAAARTRRITPASAASLASALAGRQSILITGGTGFIGGRLAEALVAAGHAVTVLTRSPAKAVRLPAPIRIITQLDQIGSEERLDAVVNLAGEPIGEGLWTVRRRRRILRSRLVMTRDVIRLIARLSHPPTVLISGSAIGWYGARGDEVLDETADGADNFSRRICLAWERAASAAEVYGVRRVSLRIGLVLAAEGGVLSRMLTPFEFGLGGPFGDGRQWMSWIHRDDLVRLIVHAMASPELAGPVNATAPAPARNAEFAAALGRALHRPAILPAPAAPLRFALGDFAEELLLSGQRVLPRAAEASGFRFLWPDLDGALRLIVGAQRRPNPAAARSEIRLAPTS